jgi:hypothetical protein
MTFSHRTANRAITGVVAALAAVAVALACANVSSAAVGGGVPRPGQLAIGQPLVASSSFGNCGTGYYCDYIYDNGTGLCFKLSPFAHPGNIPNWAAYGCRNVDGSIYDDSPFTLRIYYGPNYHDPHACINPFQKVSDLFNYDFNSGSGPHNLVIGNDIASSAISLTRCTNPL